MNPVWNSRDRYPSSEQYIKIEHWEILQMFEISICKGRRATDAPSDKVTSLMMLREDVEYLIQALQDYLQNYDAEPERSEKDCMWEGDE